jgi:hypothetical protein
MISAGAVAGEPDGAYLDPPYSNLEHPIPLSGTANFDKGERLPSRSPIEDVIALQTPVKSQGARGTCSIFSSTALLEAMLVRNHHARHTLDLSEEWLEYVIMSESYGEGSHSNLNFDALASYGDVEEQYLPYIGDTWENASYGLAAARCGKLAGTRQQRCLRGHRDPELLTATTRALSAASSPLHDSEFLKARTRARAIRRKYLAGLQGGYSVPTTLKVKRLLADGIPLALDLDFYYGAWNHREADDLGIGRDLRAWAEGVIGYPEPGSLDYSETQTKPAGHSVVVVGYDDDATVTTRVRMQNGRDRTFTYRGVYYIKNSWGTGSFGANFQIDGKRYPGYGVITQKYAEQYGAFYRLPL